MLSRAYQKAEALLRFAWRIAIIGALAGCSVLEVQDETAGWTADEFLDEGQKHMAASDWPSAIATYRKMLGRDPNGQNAEQAQLDMSNAYLKNHDRALAVSGADQFIRMHPTHPNVDYAFYLKGLALFRPPEGWIDTLSGVNPASNDIAPIQEAFLAYQELITRFPDSRYTPDARRRLIYIVNVLATHDVQVASYYYGLGADVAAVNRARSVLETYPSSSAVEDALGIMMKAYARMGLADLRDDTARVLRLNFPESRYLN
ncbi:MAG: outer membrane protein assembly factor BamD [Arenicellales bacterium]